VLLVLLEDQVLQEMMVQLDPLVQQVPQE